MSKKYFVVIGLRENHAGRYKATLYQTEDQKVAVWKPEHTNPKTTRYLDRLLLTEYEEYVKLIKKAEDGNRKAIAEVEKLKDKKHFLKYSE